MKKFRITEQKVVIAPKANNEVGNPKSYIREAISFEDLISYEADNDKDWEGWLNKRDIYFNKQVNEIEDNDRVFFTDEYGEYWDIDPRSEDGYALDGVEITIVELTEEEIIKEEAREKKKIETARKIKEEKILKSNLEWCILVQELSLEEDDKEYLLQELQKYQFPSKL